MRSILVLVVSVFLFVVGVTHGASESSKVVQASEILAKIERGELVDYKDVIIEGDLNLSKLNLPRDNTGKFIVKSKINIIRSLVKGNMDFSSVVFQKSVNFEYTNLSNGASFKRSEFGENVNFGEAYFGNDGYFRGARFYGDAAFERVRFSDGASFRVVEFCGDVHFNDAQFADNAYFWKAKVDGDAHFNNTNFICDADFIEVVFGGHAYFADANFDGIANFEEATFIENSLFKNARFNGNSYFKYVQFVSDADFSEDQFNKNANFVRSTFGEYVNFNKAVFRSDLKFNRAKFVQDVNLTSIKFAPNSSLDLSYADFRLLVSDWIMIKDNLVYDRTTYINLVNSYERQMSYDDAYNCYYDYRSINQRRKSWGDASKYIDVISWITSGYGVRPIYTLIYSVTMIVFFGFVFWIGNGIRADTFCPCIKFDGYSERVPFIDSILFSTIIFVAKVPTNFKTVGKYKYVSILEGILGWVLLAVVLSMVIGNVSRGPYVM